MANINQKNTFVAVAEQMAQMNKNSVEIISRLNDVCSSDKSVINVNMLNPDGTTTTFNFPSVGQLKSELDQANRNIQKLAGLNNNNVYVSDGTTMRKVYVDDLNREPEPIDALNTVKSFTSINNSFFESLSNPLLAVNIDLTGKIEDKVTKILSRRYIIKFQKDDNGVYTSDAQASKKDFEDKFLTKNSIFIDDFTTWYNNPNNYGILRANEPYDEQVFSLDYSELQYYGVFDVIGVDNDTINNKMWYTLGTLTYYDYSGNTRTLSIGDELIINKKNSSTKWKIKEVSTAKSNFRIILERTEGLEPVPIMAQGLKIYSPPITDKTIKVSIGFDEYNIIFVKPINTDSNIVSSTFSFGTCYYTNDLVLDTNNKISMTKYYTETVFDYGAILKDMIVKNIPSKFGKIPNAPVLNQTNFKVVQINTHLTDTKNSQQLRELHAQKSAVKSRIEQLGDAVTQQTRNVNMAQFKSNSEKSAAKTQLNTLISEQDSQTKLLSSLVSRINNEGSTPTIAPKYHIRGFWSFPEPVLTGYEGYQTKQEVVQFKVQYRYSKTGGSEPPTEGFNLTMNQTTYNTTTTTGDISDQTRAFTNPSVTTQIVNTTGYFSNWNQFLSDARKRLYNSVLDVWTWVIEDVSNADTPNINQLDIAIQNGETVEIRIKSISEVGWPDAPIESDWSNVLTIGFPTDLSQIGDENSIILQEAQDDTIANALENKLNAKGLSNHLQQSFYNNDQYIAHMDINLGTSFKDDTGNMLTLYQYLINLNTRIASLEEQILRSKGELTVTLFKDTVPTTIANGASVTITVRCEESAQSSGGTRNYINSVQGIEDYYIQFQNVAKSSQLGLLSYRKFVPTSTTDNRFYNPVVAKGSLATYVDENDILYAQTDNQFIWIDDSTGTQQIYWSGFTSNQANYINEQNSVLSSNNYNVGISGRTSPDANLSYADPISIMSLPWTGISSTTENWGIGGPTAFLTSVHPKIVDISNFVYSDKGGVKYIDANGIITLPIIIYFKMSTGSTSAYPAVYIPQNTTTSSFVTRRLKIFAEIENSSRPFEFELVFKIYRNYTYIVRTGGGTIAQGGALGA